MTIKEWKDEFADLYKKMKEDIGAEKLEISIDERCIFRTEVGGITIVRPYVKIEA